MVSAECRELRRHQVAPGPGGGGQGQRDRDRFPRGGPEPSPALCLPGSSYFRYYILCKALLCSHLSPTQAGSGGRALCSQFTLQGCEKYSSMI